jgi:elongation factor G
MTTQKRLRNIGISAHIDSGKTTLTERMLYYCGRVRKMREVHGGGGATMDSDPVERKRGITINSAATTIGWRDHQINVIDTPGHVDFTVEVERSLRVLDGAVLVLCSVGGVQSQSLTVDRQMRRYGVPRIAMINKMDRMGADPARVVAQMRAKLNTNAVALQLPIGLESDFVGVIDLIAMQAVYFDGEMGETVRRESVPVELREQATRARRQMLESLAMLDDRLMQRLLAEEEIPESEIRRVVRTATLAHQLTPVLMGSAYQNKGVQEVLDAVTMYLPSPADREIVANEIAGNAQVQLHSDESLPLVAMAFKTVVEKFGQLTYLRVYQGLVERGGTYRNARTGKSIRFGRLVKIHADQTEEIDSATAGEIVGVIGVECATGDTFTDPELRVSLSNILVAEPVVKLSIEPRQRPDSTKLAKALDRFRREDPTFQVTTDPDTGETLIAGMGQLHLEVYIDRIESDYDCPCVVGKPSVAYQERPTRAVDFVHRLKKMNGGQGQFAHLVGRMELIADDSEESFLFEDEITGGRIERKFISAARQGFASSLRKGPLGEFEVVGVKVTLQDGAQHEKDSNEFSFKNCAAEAMQKVILPKAAIALWEPVVHLEVTADSHWQGTITADMSRKRGLIKSSEVSSNECTIVAEVPLAELFDYATEIRSMTSGTGSFQMTPAGFRQVPAQIQQKVLSELGEKGS